MIQIPERVIDEIKEYPIKLQEFVDGIVEADRFKPYRVSMGIYEQRDNNTYMVRSRIAAGVASLEQVKKIVELATLYSHGYVHFTTRQDVQFHKVSLEDTAKIIEGLLEVGIMTRGTGGNTARNVVCSALSGVSKDEIFDVTADAEATTEFLLNDPSAFQLPRKYKIGFSNTNEDTANATISDLGFVAKDKDGVLGYEVYGAGGLGGKSVESILLEEFVPRNEILYYVLGMKNIFEKEGDRTNKHSARIRFIRYRLGEETFKNRLKEEIEIIKKERDLTLDLPLPEGPGYEGEKVSVQNDILVEQKQVGLYTIYVHPTNGNISVERMNQIIEFIDALDYEPSIRFTNTQGFCIRDLKGKDAERFMDLILDFVSQYQVDHSVACAGAATCKLGLCLSQNLLSAIVKKFHEESPEVKIQLPSLFISGCPNSCGQHQKGKIGLAGKAKRTDKGLVPLYTIFLNGHLASKETRLGVSHGDIPAKKIPDFLYELALLKSKAQISDFTEFVEANSEAVQGLIEKYSFIEVDNEDLYYDYGSEEKFSLKGRGPGECSAGVLDVIKLDLNNADSYLKEYETSKDSTQLYNAGVSAARSLLVLMGVDSTKERVILSEFIQHFVDTGFVKESIKEVVHTLLDYKLGDVASLDDQYKEIQYLAARVRKMYESLSPQLAITVEKEWHPTQEDNISVDGTKEKTSEDINIIDFRGVKCPINFVKVKLELSKVSSGTTIGFYLDDGEPIENVPKSVESEGHDIVTIDDQYEGYNLLVVKKK
jgi:sulfite reductase (ferredoxin)